MSPSIRLVTYNIHSCCGTDGKVDVERVARVLRGFDADIIALQEVQQTGSVADARNQVSALTRTLGMQGHFTKTRPQGDAEFGIATLVRHPFQVRAEGTLPSLKGEPRAAQWLNIRAADCAVDLVNTHLSVNFFERLRQLKALIQHPDTETSPAGVFPRLPTSDQLVLVGDFNAGFLSPEYRYLSKRLRNAQRCVRRFPTPTFPSSYPFLRLDHVWIGTGWTVENAVVHDSPEARQASDHLPLMVTLYPNAAQGVTSPEYSPRRHVEHGRGHVRHETPSASNSASSEPSPRGPHASYRATRA